jgi:hypothetical protein
MGLDIKMDDAGAAALMQIRQTLSNANSYFP